ncbi:unnamed protein product [Pylaiella littoralis]
MLQNGDQPWDGMVSMSRNSGAVSSAPVVFEPERRQCADAAGEVAEDPGGVSRALAAVESNFGAPSNAFTAAETQQREAEPVHSAVAAAAAAAADADAAAVATADAAGFAAVREHEEPIQVTVAAEAAVVEVEYSSLKVAELKDMLRAKGLKVSGRKAELIERLQEHQQVAAAAAASEVTVTDTETAAPKAAAAAPEATAKAMISDAETAAPKAAAAAVAAPEAAVKVVISDAETAAPKAAAAAAAAAPKQAAAEDVRGMETLPPPLNPGHNLDDGNAYVGEGEDLFVAPEFDRRSNFSGGSRGGGGGGIDSSRSSSSGRPSSNRHDYGRPTPGAGARAVPANGNAGGYFRGGGAAAAAPAYVNGHAATGAVVAAAGPAPALVNGHYRPGTGPASTEVPVGGYAGAAAAAAAVAAAAPAYVNGHAATGAVVAAAGPAPALVNGHYRPGTGPASTEVPVGGYAGAAAAAVAPAAAAPAYVNGDSAAAAWVKPEEERGVQRGNVIDGGSFQMATGMNQFLDPGIVQLELSSTAEKLKRVQVVAGRESARKVVEVLMDNPDVFYGCDTEVSEISLKDHGPVGHGRVTCISIYGGPEIDFGEGPGKILWVDNLGEADGTLEEFQRFFESEKHKKVWHNYGFDRHVMFNSPDKREEQKINCLGFGGDTMHMARLWDTSMEKAAGSTGFSLEALSSTLLGDKGKKTPMMELFGVPKPKRDGSPGSLKVLPPIDEIQTNPEMRNEFIWYSAYDAEATWLVHRALMQKLTEMSWKDGMTMLDFYDKYYVPFGELLTDMERTGIYVEAEGYLKDVEVRAREDKKKAEETFLSWVKRIQPGTESLNTSSGTQIQTLLFGGAKNAKSGETLPVRRVFKMERDLAEIEAFRAEEVQDGFADYTAAMLKEKLKEMGLKVSGKKDELLARVRGEEKPDPTAMYKAMSANDLRDLCATRNINKDGTKAQLLRKIVQDVVSQQDMSAILHSDSSGAQKAVAPNPKMTKYREFTVSSLGLEPKKFTASGAPAVSMDVLSELAGNPYEDPPKYGGAFKHFGGGPEGKEACKALFALCSMGSIDTMVSNFLQPLQELVDDKSRVHCSLNLNTETGRLSARKPNLQNQPALEKDQYKIRAAFRAEEGNTLVVADYGQLELRLLAHITNCKSMIDAFKEGGCFHSRTAVGMFDHVKEAVDKGEVLLEWDYSKGAPPKPLVKDVYASERRKAKTLNFSIAYGKTAHGLSKDWGVSVKQAEDLVKAWYADRPEVKKWQEQVIQNAKDSGFSRTLMGRHVYRKLPDITSKERTRVSHGARAAINTPIQGGAADVAMVAMIGIVRNPLLKKMGWKLLLQVHDEVILEGPEETAKEALAETVRCMEQPWDGVGLKKLRVDLLVDAKSAKTWYDAK